ncbi:MAG: hypothetical protein JNJ45_10315 [Chthonomonas sp.]|nr:hypothetical protein [Chthonomonas sp.]
MKRLVLLAVVVSAAASQASSRQDGSIRVDHTVNSPTMSVKYAGMKAALIEIKVNGRSRGSKVVSPDNNRGELEFALDLESLDDGDNAVEVTIYDQDGKVIGLQKTTIKVDHQTQGVVYLQGLKSGMTVEGTVELKLGVNRDFRDLYVSFFIDDEWKSLKNSQPYNYFWDTTRQNNGWHLVQAWVVDESNNTFKTKKVKVYVNNPGGRTDRIANPATQVTTQPTKPVNFDPASANGMATTKVNKPTAKPIMAVTTMRDLKSNGSTPILTEASGIRRGSLVPMSTAAGQKNLTPTGKRTVSAPVAVQTKPTVATKPVVNTKPILPNPAQAKPVVKPVVKPVIKPSAPVKGTMKISYGVKLPEVGSFNLLLDGKPIAFGAVKPRVVNGVPITPFRFLFEQAGGKVKWTHATKEVNASKPGQAVYFQIGNGTAKVNKLPVKLELKPFLEASRALVPLSFITEALKVDVDYDPATGHVLITAPKK